MDDTDCIAADRENVADATAATTAARETAQAFPAACAERWRDCISPWDASRLGMVIDVSLEVPRRGPGAAFVLRDA